MQGTIFAPGTVAALTRRNRLCPANAPDTQRGVAVLSPKAPKPFSFCVLPEDDHLGRLDPPLPEGVGRPASQDLLLRAYRLSLLHCPAPLLRLQRSRVMTKDYQLVPVVNVLEQPLGRVLIADDAELGEAANCEGGPL